MKSVGGSMQRFRVQEWIWVGVIAVALVILEPRFGR